MNKFSQLTLLHSERPKLYTILAFWSAIGLNYLINCAGIGLARKSNNIPKRASHDLKPFNRLLDVCV